MLAEEKLLMILKPCFKVMEGKITTSCPEHSQFCFLSFFLFFFFFFFFFGNLAAY
jgi:hypothetical protein